MTGLPPLDALEGEYTLITDCETAPILAAAIAGQGLEGRLTVKSHPWLRAGDIYAVRPDIADAVMWWVKQTVSEQGG